MLKETSFRSSSFSSCLACFRRSARGGGQSRTRTGTPHLRGSRSHRKRNPEGRGDPHGWGRASRRWEGAAGHPQPLTLSPGRVRRGRGVHSAGTGASWLTGWYRPRPPALGREQRGPGGDPAVPCPSRAPGGPQSRPVPAAPRPTRLPSSCCSPPPSLLSNVSAGRAGQSGREERGRPGWTGRPRQRPQRPGGEAGLAGSVRVPMLQPRS